MCMSALVVIIRQNPSVNSDHYVPRNKVVDVLKSPDFMTKGGTLGFYCQHAYAHTNEHHCNSLPCALKGVDAIFHSIFCQMGLDAKVRHVKEGMPEIDYSRYQKRIDPKQRKQVQKAKLLGTELHGLTLSNTDGYDSGNQATEVCQLEAQHCLDNSD